MLERALRRYVLPFSVFCKRTFVRKHTMLERALRLKRSDRDNPALLTLRQKAYNAREGIETPQRRPYQISCRDSVRKHTMLERALRPEQVARRHSCHYARSQKAYNAREGIETQPARESPCLERGRCQKAYNAREGIETGLIFTGDEQYHDIGQKAYNAREGIETLQPSRLPCQ